MEDIACNLKLSEAKQMSLGKAHVTLRTQADSLFEFSVQWKELEDHFDSIRHALQTEFQEIHGLKKEIGSRSADLESKELNFNSLMGAKAKELQGLVQEVDVSKTQLQSLKLSIREHYDKYEVEESRVGKVQKLVKGKETEYFNIHQRIKEVSKEIEAKERQLNAVRGKVEDQWKEFDLRDEELRAKQALIEEYDRDKSVQECMRRLDQPAKELELKRQRQQQQQEVKIEQLEYIPDDTAGNHSSANRDGRGLQLFMNEYFRRTDSVYVEVSARLQVSSDPAKLVLNAMQGFYPSVSTVENREFDSELSVIRRSCIHLLKELKRISPQINDQVREEAKKMAGDWKSKMTVAAENWLEVLGFLWLVTAYDLTSMSDREELQSLLDIAAEHEKQSDDFCGILDIADKAAASSNICSSIKTGNAANFFSPNPQVTAITDARNSQGFPNDHFIGNHILQNGDLQIACGLLSALNVNGFVELLGMSSQKKQPRECFQGSGFGDKISVTEKGSTSSSKPKPKSKGKKRKKNPTLKPKGGTSKAKADEKAKVVCYHCGKKGHWRRNCRLYLEEKLKAKELSHTVEAK